MMAPWNLLLNWWRNCVLKRFPKWLNIITNCQNMRLLNFYTWFFYATKYVTKWNYWQYDWLRHSLFMQKIFVVVCNGTISNNLNLLHCLWSILEGEILSCRIPTVHWFKIGILPSYCMAFCDSDHVCVMNLYGFVGRLAMWKKD